MNKKLQAHSAIFLANTIFGLGVPVTKLLLDEWVTPMGYMATRSLGACIVFWLIAAFMPKEKVEKKDLITILAEVARMERKTIRERVESGYKNYRANGGKVGRKEGYRKSEADMREQYAEVIRLLRKGISLRNISKITGTSVNTIRKCKALV